MLIAGGYIHGLYRKKFFHRTEQKDSMNDRMYLKETAALLYIDHSFFPLFLIIILLLPSLFLFVPIRNVSLYPLTTAHTLYSSLETQQRYPNRNHVNISKEIHSFLVWWCCVLCGSHLRSPTRSHKGAIANHERQCQHGHAWHHDQDCSHRRTSSVVCRFISKHSSTSYLFYGTIRCL